MMLLNSSSTGAKLISLFDLRDLCWLPRLKVLDEDCKFAVLAFLFSDGNAQVPSFNRGGEVESRVGFTTTRGATIVQALPMQ
jgi:hypothetical protein